MKKTLRIVLLLTLLCQYMIPVTTMAQENSSVNSSEYNDSYSSFEEPQKESTKETSVNQTDEKLQSSSEESSISSSEPSSEEQSNAPPKLRLKRASSENGPVGPNISTGPKVIGKIVDAPYVKILSEGQIIDAKYSFTPVFTSETTVKYVENGLEKNLGSQNTAYIRKNTVNSSQNTYVEFNNIGYYNGRKIGMRVVPTEFSGDEFQIVVKNTPVNGVGTLGDYQPGSIKNTPSGLAPTLEYQFFYVDTEEPAEISGHFNMGQLDLQEWLAFYPESNIVDSLVVGNNVLNEIELPNGAVTGVARQSTDGNTVSLNDPRNTFSVTFGPTTKVKLKAGAERSGSTGSTIGFSRLFPGSFSDPDPSKQVEDKKLEDKKANFVVTQLLPNRAADNKYNNFLFEDKIEEVLNIDNVKVYNGLGADVSTNFDIKIVGQNITATAKSNFLSDMNNYGQYYKMRIETTLKDNLSNEQILKYKKGTNLEVPNLASRTFDGRKASTNEVIVEYSGII
ncbi:isopeptide-forming domain-containing fimbrial protein, partial [Enterococcus faecalis]